MRGCGAVHSGTAAACAGTAGLSCGVHAFKQAWTSSTGGDAPMCPPLCLLLPPVGRLHCTGDTSAMLLGPAVLHSSGVGVAFFGSAQSMRTEGIRPSHTLLGALGLPERQESGVVAGVCWACACVVLCAWAASGRPRRVGLALDCICISTTGVVLCVLLPCVCCQQLSGAHLTCAACGPVVAICLLLQLTAGTKKC